MHDMSVYAETLADHDWAMYDISMDLAIGRRIRPWDELANQGPAQEALDGGTYILAPNPRQDETLRDAVVRQRGIGAYLRIADFNSPEYAGIRLNYSPNFAFFTRIAMEAAHVRLYSHTPPGILATDELYLERSQAPAIFARDFGVMTAEEFIEESNRWH